MTVLILAACLFLGLHLFVSGTRLRDVLTGVMGENIYLGLFSLASLGAIAFLVMAFNAARMGSDPMLFAPWTGTRDLAIPVVALAFLLAVPGLLTPNPTSVKQEASAAKAETIKGVLRITRHPFLWGVVLWSGFHLSATGDEAGELFFGTFFLLALFGTFSIDAKRRRKMGEQWKSFAAKTSNIPFGAILLGRNSLKPGELFDWRMLVAVAAFLAVLFSHARMFGLSPFPGGWVPF